jgi:hypothetical protein
MAAAEMGVKSQELQYWIQVKEIYVISINAWHDFDLLASKI